MPNRLRLINSPTDSFISFFLDTKPYHTKLLEIIETYNFSESMVVHFEESVEKEITIENDPLCKETGFGVVYDNECGFDAVDCCDLFDCFGGYGLIFDNSDQLLDLEVVNFQIENTDVSVVNSNGGIGIEAFIEIEGNHTTDLIIPIKSIPSSNEIILEGKLDELFDIHKIFVIVNIQQFEIISNGADTVHIDGDLVSFLTPKNRFKIEGKEYFYHNVSYDSNTDQTELHISNHTPLAPNSLAGMMLQVRNSNDNTGIFQSVVNSVNMSETETTLTITENSLNVKGEGDLGLGSIQLRTALKSPRFLEIQKGNTPIEAKEARILHSVYDPNTDRTRVYVADTLEFLIDSQPEDIRIATFGYFFEPGFDGNQECSKPKEENIHTEFFEKVEIFIEDED